MKRKIIKQGHNTLTMTLPSDWTKRFNLGAGVELDLIERDNGLFISTEKNFENKKIVLDISKMDIPIIWKNLMAIYREGYDEVTIKFDPNVQFESPYKFFSQHRLDARYKKHRDKISVPEALQNFINRFIDFEIVQHGKDYVIAREMGDLTSKEFDNALRRIFLILQQMADETLEAIKTNNRQILEHMHDVDINVDKFHDYCIRILNKVKHKELRKTSILFSVLYFLELIGDEFKTTSHHLLYDFSNKTSLKNIEPLAEATKNQIDSYYELFYKFDADKLNKLSDIDKTLYMTVSGMYKKSSEDEKEVYHHLRVIGRYVNALLELRVEMEY